MHINPNSENYHTVQYNLRKTNAVSRYLVAFIVLEELTFPNVNKMHIQLFEIDGAYYVILSKLKTKASSN